MPAQYHSLSTTRSIMNKDIFLSISLEKLRIFLHLLDQPLGLQHGFAEKGKYLSQISYRFTIDLLEVLGKVFANMKRLYGFVC